MEDNQGAIAVSHARTKHIDIRIREALEKGIITIEYCPDMLTKPTLG